MIIFTLTLDVVRLVVIADVVVKPVIVCHELLLTGIKLNVVVSACTVFIIFDPLYCRVPPPILTLDVVVVPIFIF